MENSKTKVFLSQDILSETEKLYDSLKETQKTDLRNLIRNAFIEGKIHQANVELSASNFKD